jgi:hypothetical protein
MSMTLRHSSLAMLLCSLCLASPVVDAGNVRIVTIRGKESVPVALADNLQKSLAFHSVAVEKWFQDATATVPAVRNDFVPLRSQFLKSTYAELEYSYTTNGDLVTRVYHAVSGHDAPYYLKSPASHPTTPTTPTGETSFGWSQTKLFQDYFPVSDVQSRATILASDTSELTADDDLVEDGFAHGRDAELKGLRTIERDIQAGKVLPGGQLSVTVSKPVCGSCESAIRKFADIYDVDVHVTEFGEGSQAWSSFSTARKDVAQRIWGHTVKRQTSHPGPGSSSGSLADDFGEDILSICGPD